MRVSVVSSPSRPCLTREYREQGESDARGGQSAGSERKRERRGAEGRKEGKKSEGETDRLVRLGRLSERDRERDGEREGDR